MSDDLQGLLGVPVPELPGDLAPGSRIFAAWEWARPLQAILKFGGWTIDDVIRDPKTAAAVRQPWSVWNLVQRDSAERKARRKRPGR